MSEKCQRPVTESHSGISSESRPRPQSQGPACAMEPGGTCPAWGLAIGLNASTYGTPDVWTQRRTAFSPKWRLHRTHFKDELKDVAQGHKLSVVQLQLKARSEPSPRARVPHATASCGCLLPSQAPAKETLPKSLPSPPGPSLMRSPVRSSLRLCN